MPMLAVAALAVGATAGVVAVTGLAIATAVTYVGIGMTIVGAVTGNKNFMKVGGIMGLAGGAMSLAGIGTSTASAVAGEAASTIGSEALDVGASLWDDAAAEAATSGIENLTADSFSTLGAGAEVGSAAGSAIAAPPVDLTSGGGVLNAQPAPLTGAPDQLTLPGTAPSAPVENIMTDSASSGLPKLPTSSTGLLNQEAPQAPAGADKKSWWASLPETTRNEIVKGGLMGASKFFESWSQQEKDEWLMEREKEKQTNLSAQPNVMRYQPPTTGLLGAQPMKAGGI